MVEVFKTNITCTDTAASLAADLQRMYPSSSVNFDLEDCDRVLRIQGEDIHAPLIVAHLSTNGHECEVML
jgi:hypothetical protein